MAFELPDIDSDIRRAQTMPGAFYGDRRWFERQREVLARSWHMAPMQRGGPAVGHAEPWTLLPGMLAEPLVWTRDRDGVRRCLSNVCTHRGRVVVDAPGACEVLTCRYHGRCFDLDGGVRAAPGFDEVAGFPSARDRLPELTTGAWAEFAFASLQPDVSFVDWIAPLQEWMGHWALQQLPTQPSFRHDYEFDAHWALYLDNFLEGFHIPYVHPSLQRTLVPNDYETFLFDNASVQVAFSRAGEPVLEMPPGHPLHGRPVAACFFFLFPGTLLNFYPWGLSINLIEPLAPQRTRVRYIQYVTHPELRDRGAGADLETVEAEDQEVVLATQRGVGARLYDRGRYCPSEERAVHHFHCTFLAAMRAAANGA